MEQLELFSWFCPRCGCVETWFDRSQTLIQLDDETWEVIEDMCDRCCNCGVRVGENCHELG